MPSKAGSAQTNIWDWLLTTIKIKYVVIALIVLGFVLIAPRTCYRWIGYPVCYDPSAVARAGEFLALLDKGDFAAAHAAAAAPARNQVTVDYIKEMGLKAHSGMHFGARTLYTAQIKGPFYHVIYRNTATNAANQPVTLFEYTRALEENGEWRVVNYSITQGVPPPFSTN